MTSEVDGSKTNEFLRRRKLRLQQVREQSKDIARKIRQRAKVENLKQVVELDSRKKKEYLQKQEKLVKKLEEYYVEGLENLGVSHKNASEARLLDAQGDRVDPSKQRGKEAAAELRKKRQQVLDKQKEILDRKLQAREAANELSRDKSAAISKLLSKPTAEAQSLGPASDKDAAIKDKDVAKNDMATQWDHDEIPLEWEPNIPTLSLPKDDNSAKETNNNIVDSKSDKSKRLDLFALSDEMPSSLRGCITNQEEKIPTKSSLTLVSEYLQNRDLRLREPDTSKSNKKAEEFQSLKQTILRTRSSKEVSGKGETIDKQFKTSKHTDGQSKKNLVTMYNHTTRDSRDIPYNDERLVVRNSQESDDAYSLAMKESTSQSVAKDSNKKVQDIRSKVAMTKQSVEKEYKDTIAFLNALPKDRGNKTIKTAYMDEHRQQQQKDMRQQKLEQEYRKIEKECSRHGCRSKSQPKPRPPPKESNDIFDSTDFQYSWMPVPESNNNLAIHTIPTTLREGKNSVKFSKVDSYHEYRSRHKHTPPTKESAPEKSKPETQQRLNVSSSDSESSTSDSSVKSVRQVKKTKDKSTDDKELQDISDAERIIIYKILDSKSNENKTSKLIKSIAKSLTMIESKSKHEESKEQKKEARKSGGECSAENIVSIEQLNEGVYKTVAGNGDNIASMYFQDRDDGITDTNVVQIERSERNTLNHRSKQNKQPEPESTMRNWDSGDEQQIRSRSTCRTDCKSCCCKPIREQTIQEAPPPATHPSAATSTTSFKTAANDKATAPEGGFIKLVDDTGNETGKFYIGASGLLKNEAYEVVIQLRKKGEEKEPKPEELKEKVEDKKAATESLGVDKVTVVSSTQTSLIDFESKENKISVGTSPGVESKDSKNKEAVRDSVVNTAPEEVNKKVSKQTITTNDLIRSDISVYSPDSTVSHEKAEFQELNTQDVPKSNVAPTSRPGTSTYTQTTMNSPTHRPILYHMSSSTSTAYMSPPEMIIPNFMKPGYQITKEEINECQRNYPKEGIQVIEHEYSMEDCDCRMCMHAKRITLSKHVHKSKHRCSKTKISTPPNTARSGKSSVLENLYFNQQCENMADLDALWDKESKCSCLKCQKRKKSTGKVTTRNSNMNNVAPKKVPSASKKRKLHLKPDIKNYVDKLLVLNKESLKAVQIVDQDCSAVTTPSSSVINVPYNIDKNKSNCENKLSLQQIQVILKNKIEDQIEKNTVDSFGNQSSQMCYRVHSSKHIKNAKLRKKTAHKVKSLNISKKMSKIKSCDLKSAQQAGNTSSSTLDACKRMLAAPSRNKIRSQSSPTPRLPPTSDTTDRSANSDVTGSKITISKFRSKFSEKKPSRTNLNEQKTYAPKSESSNHAMTTMSNDSDRNLSSFKRDNGESNQFSTQTSVNVDGEMNFMKLAEDKLQNMEKIADLTEKCTKRLSNLAKVLEEVRKNKTTAYSQITTSDASDTDQKSEKDAIIAPLPQEQSIDVSKRLESRSSDKILKDASKENDKTLDTTEYVPFLSNIPKPVAFKNVSSDLVMNTSSSSSRMSSPEHDNLDINKHRTKPPPALSRMHMRHGHDFVVPHELSTVIEVDSPMSVKLKSSRNDTRPEVPEPSTSRADGAKNGCDALHGPLVELRLGDTNNPDLLDSNDVSITPHRLPAETPDNSKMQMIDIEQFNEIMLKPFFSIQEYAKQCNIRSFDDGFNLEDIIKDEQANEELSSLHSEASLPDVISELLKRNVISEPFKFDSGSNANSTTGSSESTISVLALSRAQRSRNKSSKFHTNKENIGETSDTMSFSSNPDLENAFKNLGMGWASSTLKKTKERLALSSSSNTSSSSLSQFRLKGYNQGVPELVTDTVSSVLSLPKPQRNATDSSKNAEQQTSKTNAMTVKEFLTNELAKKITFNKTKSETQDEYMTLYETKMPEAMKHSSLMIREEKQSNDNSLQSGNNRARTSTPVQLYKSMTYHSSSSSNISNGLFSNIEDLSSVKATSNSMKHSTSDKDDLIIPNFSLRMKKPSSDCSKSD